eukprot:scaffold5683_cov156-Amphora_coffeaeformis.AAC.2
MDFSQLEWASNHQKTAVHHPRENVKHFEPNVLLLLAAARAQCADLVPLEKRLVNALQEEA